MAAGRGGSGAVDAALPRLCRSRSDGSCRVWAVNLGPTHGREFVVVGPSCLIGEAIMSKDATVNSATGLRAEVFEPVGAGNGAAIIVAYGSEGMTDKSGPWSTM